MVGLALPPKATPNLFDLTGIADRIDHRVVDLRDRDAVSSTLADRNLDIVIHMAAQALVRASIADPIGTFATNVMGTCHLLQTLRDHPDLAAILVVTSDKVYANAETGRPFAEDDPLGGKDPYSASKAAEELVASSFASNYFETRRIPVATARGGNVIGGGDYSHERIMADIVRATLADQSAVLRHPEATRPWQHVLDCLAGYLVFVEHLATIEATPRAMNFGPRHDSTPVTVGELASRAAAGLGAKAWRHEQVPDSIESRVLRVDTGLASRVLGFKNKFDALTAIDWTVDWYRRQFEGYQALRLCEEQIARYEEL